MAGISAAELAKINSFPKLVDLLRNHLEWPIEEDYGFEDVVYEYEASELGLKPNEIAKIREIHQLRPLATSQPWGIFFISFEDKVLSVTVLRRILKNLILKKRAGARASDRQAWEKNDLIFAANFGNSGSRELAFVHFSDGAQSRDLPVMKVLGWNARDTQLHNDYVGRTLAEKLRWPDDPKDISTWRAEWSSAFELRLNEAIRTSKDLALKLAGLATEIRARANELLGAETDRGPMRTMLEAFRKNLIHDLDEDGFADMFAQTIAYGMLAARISRPAGIVADNLADMVPKTNPFLKELFANFLAIGGHDKRQSLDFDELGVRDVVDMLNAANIEAVLRDFGDRNPKEDPVIHFYELFLKEYDPQKRMQRGVFYTPRPVVNFIVRGVDEILRTKFGLPLGLADTSTWAEVAARNDRITIPDHVQPDVPFVQILDPATGTGTFLVEVIDLIHQRMEEHWKEQGKSAAEIKAAWNAYVPAHLLPRLTAFELMMAPYTIAHMKVGLKLSETGYAFASEERARIFLTNALEPARDLDMEFAFISEALSHEVRAANDVKHQALFTVVIGNPPYSRVSRNKGLFARSLVQPFKDAVREEKNQQPLEDDYLKFLSLSFFFTAAAKSAVISMITNHNFNEGVLFRGAREYFLDHAKSVRILSLHGELNPEGRPDPNVIDQNVFEITTGVSISCFITGDVCDPVLTRDDIWGNRDDKLNKLLGSTWSACSSEMNPSHPLHLFKKSDTSELSEFLNWKSVPDILVENSSGVMTVRDQIAIDFTNTELLEKIRRFIDPNIKDSEIEEKFNIKSYRKWNVSNARQRLRSHNDASSKVCRILYRPFDVRSIYYSPDLVTYPNTRVMDHLAGDNIALVTSRINKGEKHAHEMISDCMVEIISLSSKSSNNAYVFPLWLKPGVGENQRRPNINNAWGSRFAKSLGLTYEAYGTRSEADSSAPNRSRATPEERGLPVSTLNGRGDLRKTLGARDLFDYIYAVLHAPSYRSRYAELLKSSFPHIPIPKTLVTFANLVGFGSELVGLHLLRSDEVPVIKSPDIRFAGSGEARVERGYPDYKNGRVMINPSRWFEDVPKATWEFHVGGYQVCEKWLKDRAGRGGKNPSTGRVLTEEDILHYRRIVGALTETRRLMDEIDIEIDKHGGWPDAFVTGAGAD
ncbi:type ISP restriction/modification enzyme [Rhizobium ruizarguesonis]